MANSLNNFNLAAIARDAIKYFGSEFFPVRVFARNFSEEIAQEGESVLTRVAGGMTASDLSGGYSTVQDVSTEGITVNLDAFKGHVAAFNDSEISKARSAKWLMEQFFEPSREATVKSLVDDAFALVLASNYTNATTKTDAQFDADALADIGGNLTTRKVPKLGRSAIISPDYHTGLIQDLSIVDKSASGTDEPIREGRIQRARGFNIYEYEGIPANGEYLTGIAMHPSAMAMAARPVFKPGVRHISVENMTEPKTGLPFQFRIWYSPNEGEFRMSCGFLYGISKGLGASLERIKSQ
jgi:hypothetical protein